MTDLGERLGRLPQEQRARLLRRMRDQTRAASTPAPVALAARDHGPRSRPSFQQEQMWFVDQLGAGRTRNNVVLAVTLRGELDEQALLRSLRTIMRRHAVLTSRLVEIDGSPWQEQLELLAPGLPTTDLRRRSGPDAEAELSRLTTKDGAAPFDLAAAPPVRARLVRMPDHAVLIWVAHHVLWDPASTHVFMEELTIAYGAHRNDAAPDLPALPLQYADFAAWQRERLGPDRTATLTRFWKDRLTGTAATEVLPDRPRTATNDGAGQGLHRTLDPAVLDRLRAIAGAHDTTLFAVLLAAFQATLARWTRTEDIVLGTASARRPHPDLRGLIGCFVEMIPLRSQIDPDTRFDQVLAGTRKQVLDAFTHSDLPFERVVEAVAPPRDPSRHPLFQIEFTALGGWGESSREAGGVEFSVEQLHDGAAKFDLSMLAGEVGGLELSLEYSTALYRDATAQALIAAYGRVLEQLAVDVRTRVADLAILSPADEPSVTGLATLGPARVDSAWHSTLDELLRAQAASSPTAVAVRFGTDTVRYDELDRWSDSICSLLHERGIAPQERVGVRMRRGPAAVAAVIGVLKAGGCYVPIDPAAPLSWVHMVVTDAGASVVLVDEAEVDCGPAGAVVVPDRDTPGRHVSGPRPEPGHLAYVLYTSGSSGRPKGVMVEHRSVTHFATAIAEDYAVTAADRMLHFAPLTFDVSVFELFTALLTGAELVVASDAERYDPALLTAMMRRDRVTVAELPPALMPLLTPAELPELRLVSVGGEAFPGRLVQEWTDGGRRFVNGYGPTEATVAVTLKDCTGAWDRNPPIGRPMAGHQTLVLDPDLRAVPPGAVGELCVAGPGLARGYLGRPDLTDAVFVANPYPCGPGTERIYRTGDLVRLLPDGDLEFLGRCDRQLKVRGFRIEPGEVEMALASHPDVAQAAVAVLTGTDGQPVLAGFVVPESTEHGPDPDDVRRHTRELLPAYMVPTVTVVERLPLTPSGKVDHRALPALVSAAATDDPDPDAPRGTAPRDEIETQISTEIVGPVLGVEHVDVEADFFAAGGSSLQATTVIARARARYGVEIVLVDFFLTPTVARLAALVRAGQQAAVDEQQRLLALFDQVESMSDDEAATLLDSMRASATEDAA